ncbi:hypothetical protein Poly41_46400 [Novipirellula artificiosorum]|uniref:RanBP2-type domain-containing protein n=2 Tax=Novipirellula artificiosorum TaxID=2528016 RepID=A0A5C6DCK3_9BACT|nr:hypothetical protein Poly41_46400 [Novipirellula artificiosorum]
MCIVRVCADAFSAETIRNRLATEGISSIVTGTDPVTALGLGGAPTNRMPRVEVAEKDYRRAIEILKADELLLDQATPWICSRCDEQNEPAFEVCWSCNKKRDDQDQAGRIEGGLPVLERSAFSSEFVKSAPLAAATADSQNPYAPPADVGDRHDARNAQNPAPIDQSARIEEETRRAFYSSIVGFFVLPPLVNFYSIYVTLSVPAGTYRSKRSQRRLILASLLNGISIACWSMIWLAQLDLL